MEYLTSGFNNLCFSKTTTEPCFKLVVSFNNQEYQYQGSNNTETLKLYYNLFNQLTTKNFTNDYKTIVSLQGNDKHIYQFSTFKKLF